MKLVSWRSGALALSALVALGGYLQAGETGKKLASFGTLEAANPETVQAEAAKWVKSAGLTADKQKRFAAIWKATDRSLADRVVDTLTLDPKAEKLLADARNPKSPAPTQVPALLKDSKQSSFFRANLAV